MPSKQFINIATTTSTHDNTCVPSKYAVSLNRGYIKIRVKSNQRQNRAFEKRQATVLSPVRRALPCAIHPKEKASPYAKVGMSCLATIVV